MPITFEARTGRFGKHDVCKPQDTTRGRAHSVVERPIFISGQRFAGNEVVILEKAGEFKTRLANHVETFQKIEVSVVVGDLDQHLAQADDMIQRRPEIMEPIRERLLGLCAGVEWQAHGFGNHADDPERRVSIFPKRRVKSTGLVS